MELLFFKVIFLSREVFFERRLFMKFVFTSIPETVEEFVSLSQFGFDSPFQVAALFIIALCNYPNNPCECYKMIDSIKGPQKLSPLEKQYISNRMIGKSNYIGSSYLQGSTPENDYTPNYPYNILIEESSDTFEEVGFASLFIKTGGSPILRKIKLRTKEGKWYLWEHSELLADINRPDSSDPWK